MKAPKLCVLTYTGGVVVFATHDRGVGGVGPGDEGGREGKEEEGGSS